MTKKSTSKGDQASSPVGRGGAGTYIEGELGAFYLLQMLAGIEARGLPDARIECVQFQGVDQGYALDDLIVHGASEKGSSLLEIQSKRTISFAPKDATFAEVCGQIARSAPPAAPSDRHLLAVATQRTSFAISGPYQDVLEWARTATNGADFFKRLAAKGVAGKAMRDFATAFRTHLVDAGLTDDDEVIWGVLRRFLILEFDFESGAPLARTHALALARQVLAPTELGRAESLWSNLIELAIQTGKTGGALDRDGLRALLRARGFTLAGDRHLGPVKARLAEMSGHALADIGTTVAGVRLSRSRAVTEVDAAREQHRLIQITGEAGVGKSSVLRYVAERQGREAHPLVLDPIGTPEGGWSALAERLQFGGTAHELLTDLAASGGGVLFLDSLEMFTTPARQRTVNDLLREVAGVDGFIVIATSRPDYGGAGGDWLAPDAVAALGGSQRVELGQLDEEEVALLREAAPELRELLDPDHPAAEIARNLYRLSRLLKVPSAAEIRTEAALAHHWWQSADGAPPEAIRSAQRLLAELSDAALAGADLIEVREDSPARAHLLGALTLSEQRRDHLGFYHDVLRDWAIGCRLHEDFGLLDRLDLSVAPSPRVARGIEFAARLALERGEDCAGWGRLLEALSPKGAHGGWRRQALMAILRSELSLVLLARCSATLLARGGAILTELATAVVAVDTAPAVEVLQGAGGTGFPAEVPQTLRMITSSSGPALLRWCMDRPTEVPIQALPAVVKLVEVQVLLLMSVASFARPVTRMLFGWLMQLDLRATPCTIPSPEEGGKLEGGARSRMIEELRTMALVLAGHAPDEAKAYLTAVADENDSYKVKAIRPLSKALAPVAPKELAALITASLAEPVRRGPSRREPRDRALSFVDIDYMPQSPAQPPFLDLLAADAAIGLELIRDLTARATAYYAADQDPEDNGYTIQFPDGPRFFPWVQTYFWSRDQAREHSVASGLMALEAWGHDRIEAGDPLENVLADVLGPVGSPAAYLLVAVDLLISHWPATRDALVPFLACPELLTTERSRSIHERMGRMLFGQKEPAGRVRLADLAKRPSRGNTLEDLLPAYLVDDEAGNRLRGLLAGAVERLGPYRDTANFGDPAFMAAYASNLLQRANWVQVEQGLAYRSPQAEAAHLAAHETQRQLVMTSSEMEARIQLATRDPAQGSPDTARAAVDYAGGALPDGSDTDVLKTHSTRLIATALLAARDGDDALLAEQEQWIRAVVAVALEEDGDRPYSDFDMLAYNRPALGLSALLHLWRRGGNVADRDALLAAAARSDLALIPAIAGAPEAFHGADPRLLKAATRIGFTAARYRWHPWDEDETETQAYAERKAETDSAAVGAEIAWIDGDDEPDWPVLPPEKPTLRRRPRVFLSDETRIAFETEAAEEEGDRDKASVHANSQALAHWLSLIARVTDQRPDWTDEIVDAYAGWTATLNGYGLPADAEADRSPDEWNHQFYLLAARPLLNAPPERYEVLLGPIEALPDQPFCDVATSLIHAADVLYFNDRDRPPERAVDLRRRLVARTRALDRWDWQARPGDHRIDHETGPVIATLLMNNRNPFASTETYLVPAVFDRIDPLLDPLAPLMPGGPVSFVALCTLNTLLTIPRARHLDFMLGAVEAWLDGPNADPTMWHALGLGNKLILWFNRAAIDDPALLLADHPSRTRIDAVLGRMVALGVSEAHTLEKKIEANTVLRHGG
jgi:hypothetical protein